MEAKEMIERMLADAKAIDAGLADLPHKIGTALVVTFLEGEGPPEKATKLIWNDTPDPIGTLDKYIEFSGLPAGTVTYIEHPEHPAERQWFWKLLPELQGHPDAGLVETHLRLVIDILRSDGLESFR